MTKKRVMIAEDDASILEAMQIMLEDVGYEVMAVEDGKIVRDMQGEPGESGELPDVLLLDIWMSGMDGTDICRHLKSQNRTRHIPIILCSANKDIQHLVKMCGADDFIAKPFEMVDLISKVEKYMNPV